MIFRRALQILVLSSIAFPAVSASPTSFRWNKGRGYAPFSFANDSSLTIDNTSSIPLSDLFSFPAPVDSPSFTFRAANTHAHPQKRFPYLDSQGRQKRVKAPAWSFIMVFESADTLRLSLRSTEHTSLESSSAAAQLTLSSSATPSPSSWLITSPSFSPHAAPNSWDVSLRDGRLSVRAGSPDMVEILDIPFTPGKCTAFGFEADPAALLCVTDIAVILPPAFSAGENGWMGKDAFDKILKKSSDPLQGYWAIFDRDLDESLLKPGGDYRLALVKENSHYVAYYLDGASVNKKNWRQGMVKAILAPDKFDEVLEVTWFDAEREPLSESVVAQTEEGDIIRIQFPYQNSSLRLKKIPTR